MPPFQELVSVFTQLQDAKEMESFFHELFTPKEIEDISFRWQLLKELHDGKTQRSIATRHKLSLCKITRGSKVLKKENSVTKKILDTIKET
jgi:TrpR family transcriptional regulator, trp operon repressor